MMPDLFSFWLSGHAANEYTIATTSQCLDVASGQWATGLLERLSLPARIFGEIVLPGTVLGDLLPHVAEEAGLPPKRPVVAVGGHDTALAVAAVPAAAGGFAYLSSGTWSLLGAEIPRPFIGESSRAANFTNEGGVGGTISFLKNLCGLWLVQECRRHWGRQGEALSYDSLTEMAAAAPAFRSLVDVDDPAFAAPGDMPAWIQALPGEGPAGPETGAISSDGARQPPQYTTSGADGGHPRATAAPARGRGSTRNRLLCQLAADATGRPVVAGPVENHRQRPHAGGGPRSPRLVAEAGRWYGARSISTFEPRPSPPSRRLRTLLQLVKR
jgi:rhamnulokinase